MCKILRVRDFSREHDYGAFAIVRVYNAHLASLGGRNAWIRVIGANKTLIRRVRGGGAASAGLPADGIELDYDSRLELNVVGSRPDENRFYACEVELSKATALDKFMAHWAHPNLEYRVPYQIAIVSAVLGAIGLFLGVVSLVK